MNLEKLVKKTRSNISLATTLFTISSAPLAATNEVRVCSLQLPPQTMLNKQGEPDGFAVRILQGVSKQLNWKLTFIYSPWMRVVNHAKSGKCDLMMTVLNKGDYSEYMTFPKSYIINQKNVLVKAKGKKVQYSGDLETFMRKHDIALYRDKRVDDKFEYYRKQPWAKLEEVNQIEQAIMMLLANRIDAYIENDLTSAYKLRELGLLDQVEVLSPPLNTTPAYITFPHAGNLVNQVDKYDNAIETYKKTSEYKALEKHYLGN
ncbi:MULTISPECIES: substrate-binding periplasmic protein [unclassified Marinomonas]|uniref:substrate-binding periplasmic protein n=1 Tax=unclassified Marinomonas TaxID=196814 RepID=UPI0007AFC532|nr:MULTISPECIES: transporter substrate-binding domain-containing protein [unclassified Marinomonas]